VIGTHQIDRFEAINLLQKALKEKPDNAADWVILGELAHEVALDAPADQAMKYFSLSREAYDKALRLEPDNAGLKAAVQFAKDQEANAEKFEQRRKEAVQVYLESRRQELTRNGITPTVEIYSAPSATASMASPQPGQQPPQAVPGQATTAWPAQSYPYAVYRPFTTAQGTPYTYQQYSNTYLPQNAWEAGNPVTMRQYSQSLPQVMMNSAGRVLRPR
jgi:tetratricopeptide (TPR) repeat protein